MQKMLQIVVLASLSCVSVLSQAQSFYKWVDKNGSTHYTKTPPPKNAKAKGQVETYHFPVQAQTTTTTPANTAETTQAPAATNTETPNNNVSAPVNTDIPAEKAGQ